MGRTTISATVQKSRRKFKTKLRQVIADCERELETRDLANRISTILAKQGHEGHIGEGTLSHWRSLTGLRVPQSEHVAYALVFALEQAGAWQGPRRESNKDADIRELMGYLGLGPPPADPSQRSDRFLDTVLETSSFIICSVFEPTVQHLRVIREVHKLVAYLTKTPPSYWIVLTERDTSRREHATSGDGARLPAAIYGYLSALHIYFSVRPQNAPDQAEFMRIARDRLIFVVLDNRDGGYAFCNQYHRLFLAGTVPVGQGCVEWFQPHIFETIQFERCFGFSGDAWSDYDQTRMLDFRDWVARLFETPARVKTLYRFRSEISDIGAYLRAVSSESPLEEFEGLKQ